MNEVVVGQAALSGALWLIIAALKQAVGLPPRTIPLFALLLGVVLYMGAFHAGVLSAVENYFSAGLAGIIAGGAAIGLNSGVRASLGK